METVEPVRQLTPELRAEFEANAKRPLQTRMRYAFIRTYKPLLDDVHYRSFDSMASTLWLSTGACATRTCPIGQAMALM